MPTMSNPALSQGGDRRHIKAAKAGARSDGSAAVGEWQPGGSTAGTRRFDLRVERESRCFPQTVGKAVVKVHGPHAELGG
jgi:hypothetical protein